MKNENRRAIFAAIILVIAGLSAYYFDAGLDRLDRLAASRMAYIAACELMGGSALIGQNETKICIKNENLIVSE